MTIHFMRYGVTPCRMEGVPRYWPAGHSWSSNWKDVNCKTCMKRKKVKLIPPDPKQCQCEERTGDYSFMTLGPIPPLKRCTEKPVCIVTELQASKKDGLRGSMSLCGRHLAVMMQRTPNHCSVKAL